MYHMFQLVVEIFFSYWLIFLGPVCFDFISILIAPMDKSSCKVSFTNDLAPANACSTASTGALPCENATSLNN